MGHTLYCIVLTIVTTTISTVYTACRPGWEQYNNNCYLFNKKDHMRWIHAQGFCYMLGAKLAEPLDATTNTWLSNRAKELQSGRWYIGLNDLESDDAWMWSTSRKLLGTTYSGWAPGNPYGKKERNCVAIETGLGWIDDRCNSERPYICEMPSIRLQKTSGRINDKFSNELDQGWHENLNRLRGRRPRPRPATPLGNVLITQTGNRITFERLPGGNKLNNVF